MLNIRKIAGRRSQMLWVVMAILSLTQTGCQRGVQQKPEPGQRVANGVYVQGGQSMQGMTAAEVRNVVRQIAQGQERQPKNAKFNEENGEVIAEEQGCSVNQEQTVKRILDAKEGTQVELVYDIVQPDITAEKLKRARLIGRYTTPVLDDGPERVQNLKQTSQLLTNSVIAAQQVFSFNATIGEPTPERGFKEAPIITPEGKAMGLGGGMCQVSSTLYNAALAAKLPIVERHPHSQPVAYVPPDRDAMTFTNKDFKFKNILDRSIVIKALADHNRVMVEIFELGSR